MDQLRDMWAMTDGRRRAMLIGGAAALLAVLLILTRIAATPSYALLYSGLDAASAGEVIGALEARGVRHQIRGDAIFVEETTRDSLRMSLAGEGLPATGAAGYELLDTLSGFGTTSQMFDAAYWRAKEGELARTILSSPRIRAARVHLATPGADPFREAQAPSASVSIRPAAGGITSDHARALRFLVASAVPGLLVENVTVIDTESGRVVGGEDPLAGGGDAATRADALRRNIERLLTARVGPGNAVVEVSVALETARETLFERRIDPDSRVIVGTDTEERANTSTDRGGAGVTVASNLPDGDAAPDGGGTSSSQDSESRERVTYDLSETQREIERAPGAVRRISVAVLVNAVEQVGADGIRVSEPRGPEELAALEALVQSAIGYDAARGDRVTIQSLAFEPVTEAGPGSTGSQGLADRLDPMGLLRLAALLLVAVVVALGVVRPALRARARPGPALTGPIAAVPALAAAGPDAGAAPAVPGLAPPDATGPDAPAPGGTAAALTVMAPPDSPSVALPDTLADRAPGSAGQLDDPVARLRRLIEEREEETVEILRGWMEQDEEPAR